MEPLRHGVLKRIENPYQRDPFGIIMDVAGRDFRCKRLRQLHFKRKAPEVAKVSIDIRPATTLVDFRSQVGVHGSVRAARIGFDQLLDC